MATEYPPPENILLGRSTATTPEQGEHTNRVTTPQTTWGWNGCGAWTPTELQKGIKMKVSQFKDYSQLPLFLNAELVAGVLGVSPSSSYELMHESDFPVLKVGNRMVVPKEKFIQWVEQHTQGGAQ